MKTLRYKVEILLIIILSSCSKESLEEIQNQITSIDKLERQNDSQVWSTESILKLVDKIEPAIRYNVKSLDSLLTPEELKYGLEALLNKEFRATKPFEGDYTPHVEIHDLVLVGSHCTKEFTDSLYLITKNSINNLIAMGLEFHIVDFELTTDDKLVTNILTSDWYIDQNQSFGFNLFPNSGNYNVLSESFVTAVNNRLTWEYLDPETHYYTDLYPDPSFYPNGLGVFSSTILGSLGLGDCLMYAGTLENYGGPEIVFGRQYDDNYYMSGTEVNERILRGINYIEDFAPTEGVYHLINLRFSILENIYAAQGNDCLPGDACNQYYPCFGKSHMWSRGRFARKASVAK